MGLKNNGTRKLLNSTGSPICCDREISSFYGFENESAIRVAVGSISDCDAPLGCLDVLSKAFLTPQINLVCFISILTLLSSECGPKKKGGLVCATVMLGHADVLSSTLSAARDNCL